MINYYNEQFKWMWKYFHLNCFYFIHWLFMTQEQQLKLMEVLEKTESIMCNKYNYDWEDPKTLEVKPEYVKIYDKYYLQFWNIIHNTNYLTKYEINNK